MSSATPITPIAAAIVPAAAIVITPPTANLGPLETTFTPVEECTTLFTYTENGTGSCPECLILQQGRHCEGGVDMPDVLECWPPQHTTDTSSTIISYDLLGRGYYSPGIYCPAGYHTACTAIGTESSNFGFQYPPSASETAIGCCPLNYTCLAAYEPGSGTAVFALQTCMTFATSVPVVVATCTSGAPGFPDTLPPHSYQQLTVNGSSTSTEYLGTAMLLAPMIQLLRQDSDLSKFPLSTGSSSLATGAPTSSKPGTSPPPVTQNTNVPASSGSRHLSKGAIAGITIGTLIGTLAMLGAVVYLFRTRRRLAKGGTATTPAMDLANVPSAAPALASASYSEKTQEPATTAAQSKTPGDGPYEMPAASVGSLHELP